MTDRSETGCPRCGYDQRGVIASWTEACPLESICTECGLSYSCAELLVPGKFEPLWCVEFARGNRRAVARSCAGTLARSFMPWRFWARLKMSHRIRPRRLAAYVCALLLPFLLLPLLAQIAAAVFMYNRSQFQNQMQVWFANARVQNLTLNLANFDETDPVAAQRAEDLRRQIAALQVAQTPPTLDLSRAAAVVEAVFMPLASRSAGTYTFSDGTTTPYSAPNTLWPWVLGNRGGGANLASMAIRTRFALELSLLHVLAMIAAFALFPLTFALLPQSRRKAKVRWAHVARATIYGLFIPLHALLVAMICATFILAEVMWYGFMLVGAAATLALPIAAMVWWAFAIRHYMKMPNAFFVSASLMLLTLLGVCAIAWLTTEWSVVPDSWLLLT